MENRSPKKPEIEIDQIIYEINEEDGTASITKSPNANEDIIIPTSIIYESKEYIIKEIKSEAFSYNENIKSITFLENSQLKIIDKNCFSNSSLESLYIPDSVEHLEQGFGNGAYLLTDIKVSPKHKRLKYINNCYLIYESVLIFARRNIEKARIPTTVKRIAERSFDSCYSLTTVSFTSSKSESIPLIEEISDFSFYHCSNLTQVEIPPSLKKIGDYGFYYCDKMKTVSLKPGSNLFEIGRGAFFNSSLKTLIIPPSVKEIKEGFMMGVVGKIELKLDPLNKNFIYYKDDFIISNCVILFVRKNIEFALIPSFVTRIAEGAFDHCTNLKSVSFELNENNESSLIEIGQYAFANCLNLSKFDIPMNLELIDDYAFQYCEKLTAVKPLMSDKSNLIRIGNNAFLNCNSLVETEIPLSVKIIGKNAFFECEKLSIVNFAENLNEKLNQKTSSEKSVIDDYAFSNCLSLTKIIIPSKFTKIGRFAFSRCLKLNSIKFSENSELQKIGNSAFKSTEIEKFEIPSKVNFLEDGCFNGTLKTIQIYLSPQNKDIVLFQKSLLIHDNCIVYAKHGIKFALITSNIKRIGYSSFISNQTLETVKFSIVDSKLTEIGDHAFAFCDKLRNLSAIPPSVKLVSEFCFLSAKSLVYVEFLGDEITLNDYAFEKCRSLSLISFPNAKVINIKYQVFFNVSDRFVMFTIPNTKLFIL